MSTSTEIVRLQQQIEDLLAIDGKLYFDFSPENNDMRLSLVTVRASHKQPFLYHSLSGEDRKDALQQMITYIQRPPKAAFVFEVRWYHTKYPEVVYTSRFRGASVFEVLDKCYYQTKPEELVVKSIRRLEEQEVNSGATV